MDDITVAANVTRLKAFLIECSEPSWVEVARHLKGDGIDVVYWVAWSQIREAVMQRFPDVLFHDTIDAKRANPQPQLSDAAQTLFTADCRHIWEHEAQAIYEMMLRFDHSRDLIYVEASTLFYQLLLYWNAVLDRMRPDVVVFPTPPHVVYDYIILMLCQRKGIKTVLFEQAWIYPPYSMSMRDFREGSEELRQRYAKLMSGPKPVPLSDRGREILDRLAGRYEQARAPSEAARAKTAKHDVEDAEFWAEQQRFFETNVEMERKWFDLYLVRGLRGYLHRRKSTKPVPYEKQVNISSLAKQRGKSLADSFEGDMPNQHYLEQRATHMRIARERYAEYQSLASQPRRKERFIFLPLMYQPERTSCPQGGIFSNQQIVVNMLSNLVPDDVWIYVKEHPTQLHFNMQSTQARSAEFYSLLANFKNVRLMELEADPFSLIDGCLAVATVTGTGAIEAVARGKPALVFGHAYYNDCAGIYPVASEADVRRALAEIIANPYVKRADVEAYFHAIETTLFMGIADANLSNTNPIEGAASNIAKEIVRRVRH